MREQNTTNNKTNVNANTNADLSRLFQRMASALQLLGENPFKVNAHNRVARVLKDLTEDIRTIAAENPDKAVNLISDIEGIGAKSAKKIVEYLNTGRITEYDELMSRIPSGLFDILAIPGLGPKTVKLMWEQLDITTLNQLKKNLDNPALAGLPRMGKKTIENIRKAISFVEQSADRIEIGLAHPFAADLVERLRAVKGVKRVQYAGSLRRGKETIGDIDILVSCKDAKAVRDRFTTFPEVMQILAGGETKSSVRIKSDHLVIQCDLRIVPDSVYGAALMYFTGSKEHNVVLRERAIKQGKRLNEYGLFQGTDERPQDNNVKPIASKSEEEIYAALDLPCIPPELREEHLNLNNIPTNLIKLTDIKAELHAHTNQSDGKLTLDELIEEAQERGYHTIAVTDHSQSSVIANGLSPDRLRKHIENIRKANERHAGITVLAGSEVDILIDGSLDYEDDLLAQLDIVVASPHASLRQEPAVATKRLLRAIRHPLVHIIGHPTGRIILNREGLHPDINQLCQAAAESNTALEINANWKRLDLRENHVRTAIKHQTLIAIDTDAHNRNHFDNLQYGIKTARRAGLSKQSCINTWPAKKLHHWLKSKRK